MILEGLSLGIFGLAVFDSWLTCRRIKRYGAAVELNPVISKLSKLLGPEAASVIGIVIPTLLWVLVSKLLNAPWILAVIFGFRLRFFYIQLESLKFENVVRTELMKAGIYKPKVGDASTRPPSSSEAPDALSSPSPTFLQRIKKWLS